MKINEIYKRLPVLVFMLKKYKKDDELMQIDYTLKKLSFKRDLTNEEKKEELEKLIDFAEKVVSETIKERRQLKLFKNRKKNK